MSLLFEPGQIGTLSLKNRFVRSATAECLVDDDYRLTDRYLDLYKRLARGQVGLIISGNLYVHPMGRALARIPMLDRDEIVDDLRRLTSLVHEHGSKIVAQLNHGGRQCAPDLIGEKPIGPSAVRDKINLVKPRAMTESEIETAIDAFGSAAKRVEEADFDGVQIHAAHGFLINQFLSPHTNRRKDRWGGDFANRTRFLREVYRTVRSSVGDDFPILIKINAEDGVKSGVTLEECVATCKQLEQMGLDAVEISGGIYESGMTTIRGDIPVDVLLRSEGLLMRILARTALGRLRRAAKFQEGYHVPHAAAVKSAVNIPVITVGGIRRRATMERVLEDGHADFIAMCRPFIRNPNLVKAMIKGKDDPVTCENCNRCTLEVVMHSMPLKCYQTREHKDRSCRSRDKYGNR